MKKYCYFIFLIEALLLILSANNVKANWNTIGQTKPTNGGLYNNNDAVDILNAYNLKSSVYNSRVNWLVQFYLTWCGHCQGFSPIFKKFAHQVRASKYANKVRIAVVNCADDLNTPICREFGVTIYPTIRFFSANANQGFLGLNFEEESNSNEMLKRLINQLNIVEGNDQTDTYIPDGNDKVEEINPATIDSNSKEISRNETKFENFQNFGDFVFQIDLEKALLYSLVHEISLQKVINGDKMLILKNYLYTLSSYFPMRGHGQSFLISLYYQIYNMMSISGENFQQLVSQTGSVINPPFVKNEDWIDCKGEFRKYPCGLWTMFHMLTVNERNENFYYLQNGVNTVLQVMYFYIQNFFGCEECSKHFVEMAIRRKLFNVRSKDESILWLWKAHNEVNQRLAAEYKLSHKIQYPSEKTCPSCRDQNNNWIESEVLRYLKKKYSYIAINWYGIISH